MDRNTSADDVNIQLVHSASEGDDTSDDNNSDDERRRIISSRPRPSDTGDLIVRTPNMSRAARVPDAPLIYDAAPGDDVCVDTEHPDMVCADPDRFQNTPDVNDPRIWTWHDEMGTLSLLPSRTRHSSRRKKKQSAGTGDEEPAHPAQPGDIELDPVTALADRQRDRRRSLRNTLRKRSKKSVRRDAGSDNMTMAQRKTIRRNELNTMQQFEVKNLPICTRVGYEMTIWFQRGWRHINEGLSNFHIWGSPIREIEGNLGSGVSTYFRVLRWLLKINIFNLIFAMCLITAPGVLIRQSLNATDYNHTYNADDLSCSNPNFMNTTDNLANEYANYVLQFLTGTGWVEKTPLYIGWYPSHNKTNTDEIELHEAGCLSNDSYDCYTYNSSSIIDKLATRENAIKDKLKCALDCSEELICNIRCNEYDTYTDTSTDTYTELWNISAKCFDTTSYGSSKCQFPDLNGTEYGLKCDSCYRKHVTYNFSLAYVCVGLCYFAISLLWVSRNIMKLFKKSAVETLENKAYSQLVLGGWDYNIQNKKSAVLKSKSIVKSLKEELMSDEQKEVILSTKEKACLWLLRIVTNLICVAAMGATIYLYYEVSQQTTSSICDSDNDDGAIANIDIANISSDALFEDFMGSYAPSVIVSVSNIIFPVFFEQIGNFERYQFQSTRINVTLTRSFVMKLFSIISYLWILYGSIQNSADPSFDKSDEKFEFNCWENFMGSELFRLCVIDFAIFCFALFLSEYGRRFVVSRSQYVKKAFDVSEFNISKEVLDLAYKQMIFWSALFFCPLISVVAVLVIVLMFYMKKMSALKNVRPPEKVILNSSSSSIINAVFIVSLLTVFVPIGYFVFNFTPSKKCGPFQGLTSFVDPVNVLIGKSGKFKSYILDNLKVTSVVVVIVVVTLIILYYFYSLAAARDITIQLLREQIKSENQDKKFLIEQIKSKVSMGNSSEDKTTTVPDDQEIESGKKKKKKKKEKTAGTYANPNVRLRK